MWQLEAVEYIVVEVDLLLPLLLLLWLEDTD